MKCTFKVKKDERIYINEEYISNGYWAVKRKTLAKIALDKKESKHWKELLKLMPLSKGTYGHYLQQKMTDDCPDISRVFPSEAANTIECIPTNDARINCSTGGIEGIRFEGKLFEQKEEHFYVAPHYWPLMALGDGIFMKDKNSPVLVMQGTEAVACVMPVRL